LHAFSAQHSHSFLAARKRWDEERYFCEDLETFIPSEVRDDVRKTWRQLQCELRELPAGPSAPMHLDLGYSNFHRDGDQLHVFDFDNCALAPEIGDIAVALYGSLFNLLRCEYPGDRAAFDHPRTSQNLAKVLPPFRAGYEAAHPWPGQAIEHLPLLMEFCYFRSVVHAFRMQHPVTNPRVQSALDKNIENLLNRQLPFRCEF
jgi:Ser/Thr protein kinase RdoA (MazF antagonist)